jgi:hypothetical protein
LVVPGATVDFLESQARIEAAGSIIVSAHLKENRTHEPLASFDEQSFDEQSSKAFAAVLWRNSDRLNVAIPTAIACAQPCVANNRLIAIWSGDKVVTGWMG